MNKLEEIKKKIDDLAYWGDISPNAIENDVEYLLSIIEQAEQALSYIAYSENITAMNSKAEDALQAIRGSE